MRTLHTVKISTAQVLVDNKPIATNATGMAMLTEVYRSLIGDYSKYFKMDALCKLGFVASELLLQAAGERHSDSDDRAVVLFNRSSSLCNDRRYQATIDDTENFFPSPAIFVYTLANIVTGEIAIRNKYYGETSFYVLEARDQDIIDRVTSQTLASPGTTSAIAGWLEVASNDEFEAEIHLIEK